MVLKLLNFLILRLSVKMLDTFERNITCLYGSSWHLNGVQVRYDQSHLRFVIEFVFDLVMVRKIWSQIFNLNPLLFFLIF